jgi:predicted RNA binding protein YcfA (HicA-like mRNA interferase family)
MPAFGPIKRKNLIRALADVGFTGPISGGRHAFMVRGDVKVFIPNPHGGDIGIGLLARILGQAGISREEWETL